MGLFRRRKDQQQPTDRIEWITRTARQLFAERGIESTIEHGARPEDVTLVAADGQRYPLFNVFANTHDATADEASRKVAEHIDNLLDARSAVPVEQLSAEQLRQQVRTRILPSEPTGPGEPTFGYARAFSDDLILALCVDYPTSVSFIADGDVDRLALSLDELYAFGQLNTDREPVDERLEPAPGIELIVGNSLFTASKAANLPAVIGASPFGTLFTLPHRHMLIALPITGPDTVSAVEHLVGVTMHVLRTAPPPGGVISADVLFSRNNEVTKVSSMDDEGAVSMVVDDRLQQALEEALG